METKAIAKNIRISPEKVNLLVAQIKKLPPSEAVNVLSLVNKSSSPVLRKVIKSAIANAKNNRNLTESELMFKEIIVTKGPMFKRFQPISRGRAHHILKRSSHITVILTQKPSDKKQLEQKAPKVEVKNESRTGDSKLEIQNSRQRRANGTKS